MQCGLPTQFRRKRLIFRFIRSLLLHTDVSGHLHEKSIMYNTVDAFLDLIWTMLTHVAYPESAKVVLLSTHFRQRLNFHAVPPGIVSLFTGGL